MPHPARPMARPRLALVAAAALLAPGGAAAGQLPEILPPGSVDTLFVRGDSTGGAAAGAGTVADLLVGRSPTLRVDRRWGVPGEVARLWLREARWAGASVVVYVDGVRVDGLATEVLRDRAPDALLDIDPELVERVELVRGPVAAGRWGSDAAGGVLLITTRRDRAPSGFAQAVSLTAGASSPRDVGRTWWTCTGTEGLEECGGVAPGTVVSADGLARTGLAEARPHWGARWRGGWTGARASLGGTATTEDREGAAGPDGFVRHAASLYGRIEPLAGVTVTVDGAVAELDVGARRFAESDVQCMAVDWATGPDVPNPAPWCLFAYGTAPLGAITTRSLGRRTGRFMGRVTHSPARWLEHAASYARYTAEDGGTERWAFEEAPTDFRGEFDVEGTALEYAARTRAGVRAGWALRAEVGVRSEALRRAEKEVQTTFVEPEPEESFVEARSEIERTRIRGAVEVAWRDRAILTAALLHETGNVHARLRPATAAEDRPLMPSVAAAYRMGDVRLRASWGRSRTNLHHAEFFTDFVTASPFHHVEVETLEGGVDAVLGGGRWRGALTATRSVHRNERVQGAPGGLRVWTATTDALELRVAGDVVRRDRLVWDIALAALAPFPRASEAEAPVLASGSLVVIVPGERHDAFWVRPIVGVDTVNGWAVIGPELVDAGHTTPRLESSLRSGLAFGALRLDAHAQLRVGETALNEWGLYRDRFRTSRPAHDPALDPEERLRRFGPYFDGSGLAFQHSGQYLEEASFLRLRAVALSLRLPERLLGLRLPAADLTLAGRDLWTWTDFSGPDPEVPRLAPPHPRVWTTALTVRF